MMHRAGLFRRSTRLRGYDYTQPAAYFVTICTHGRVCLFGGIVAGAMRLNACGYIVDVEWRQSAEIRDEVYLDAFVVMPDHLHGIVVIGPPGADPTDGCDPRGYSLDPFVSVGPHGRAALQRPPKSPGAMVVGFKSAATKRINRVRGTPGAPVWQYKFHDRILRTEREWFAVRRYIEQNPARGNEAKTNR